MCVNHKNTHKQDLFENKLNQLATLEAFLWWEWRRFPAKTTFPEVVFYSELHME